MAPSSSNVIDFDARRVEPFVMKAIEGFLNDPPDSDYQRGYLAGLVNVYREGLGRGVSDARLEAADRLLGAL
ncbi:hypothetical protein [Bosea sp. RAC05]|uniref:hypothetical protein n=1 Tax=Bosea sp. RAC05 TaxID=1842539 RepID=UPI00085556CA|nr:hypothetical protein [Bosea sp. RAC05]AOG03091.1 hypothetical protein BSY19_4839 [Bosea sp. RAC05]